MGVNKTKPNPEFFSTWLAEFYKGTEVGGVGKAAALTQAYLSLGVQQILNLYELGKTINELKEKYGSRHIRQLVGLAQSVINKAAHLANEFHSEEELKKYLLENGIYSYGKILYHNVTRRHRSKSANTLISYIEQGVAELIERKEKGELEEKEFISVQKALIRILSHFPTKRLVGDKYFLLYSFCVSCGEFAGEEKLRLIPHPKFSGIEVPVCKQCEQENKPINPDLVALLFANYASNIETAFENLEDKSEDIYRLDGFVY